MGGIRYGFWRNKGERRGEQARRPSGFRRISRNAPLPPQGQSALKRSIIAVILTVQTVIAKMAQECRPEKGGHLPRTGKWGGGFRKVQEACRWSTGETFPGRNPGPADAVEAASRAFPEISCQLLKRCGRLHTPSRTGAARFSTARFSNGIVSLQPSIGRMVMDSSKKTIKARRAVYRVLNILERVISAATA